MVKISGGDGSSIENAIIISDCTDIEGVDQEYLILRSIFGEFTLIQQVLLNQNKKFYDKLEVEVKGKKMEIFFDITDFFGKGFEL
ncbi:MAG: hypothetical protein ACTSR8_11625 [Promethearchaeota archaeon]